MASYKHIRTQILRRITDKEWPPGQLIPNEQELAEEFGSTRATVNRAMQELADAGYVERKRKAGTRVVERSSRGAVIQISVIRKEIEDQGKTYCYKLLNRELATPPDPVKTKLELKGSTKALYLQCLHFANEKPSQLEDRWINLKIVTNARTQDFSQTGPNEWLLREMPYTNAEHSFAAEKASANERKLLALKPNEPVFTITRRTWLIEASVTYVRLSHPGSSYRLTTSETQW